MATKNYKQLQDEAELLGIRQNQTTAELVNAINAATSSETVGALLELNKKLGEAVEALQEKLDTGTRGQPVDPDSILAKITELHKAQLADREVYTNPYRTGLANALLMAIGVITDEDISEKLLKPVTQVDIKGAKVLSGRQQLIRAASKFVTMANGKWRLRSGLTSDQIAEADEIMKRLKVEKGTYEIPAE